MTTPPSAESPQPSALSINSDPTQIIPSPQLQTTQQTAIIAHNHLNLNDDAHFPIITPMKQNEYQSIQQPPSFTSAMKSIRLLLGDDASLLFDEILNTGGSNLNVPSNAKAEFMKGGNTSGNDKQFVICAVYKNLMQIFTITATQKHESDILTTMEVSCDLLIEYKVPKPEIELEKIRREVLEQKKQVTSPQQVSTNNANIAISPNKLPSRQRASQTRLHVNDNTSLQPAKPVKISTIYHNRNRNKFSTNNTTRLLQRQTDPTQIASTHLNNTTNKSSNSYQPPRIEESSPPIQKKVTTFSKIKTACSSSYCCCYTVLTLVTIVSGIVIKYGWPDIDKDITLGRYQINPWSANFTFPNITFWG